VEGAAHALQDKCVCVCVCVCESGRMDMRRRVMCIIYLYYTIVILLYIVVSALLVLCPTFKTSDCAVFYWCRDPPKRISYTNVCYMTYIYVGALQLSKYLKKTNTHNCNIPVFSICLIRRVNNGRCINNILPTFTVIYYYQSITFHRQQ